MNSKQDKLERDKLVEKLREIASGSRRSKSTRLREIFDDVEAAKANGATNKEIVAGLAALNLIFDVNNFKNSVSRIRKERTIVALTSTSIASASLSGLTAPSTNQNKLANVMEVAKFKTDVANKNVVNTVTKSSGKRKSILNVDKGMFGDLDPPPVNGIVDLKKK